MFWSEIPKCVRKKNKRLWGGRCQVWIHRSNFKPCLPLRCLELQQLESCVIYVHVVALYLAGFELRQATQLKRRFHLRPGLDVGNQYRLSTSKNSPGLRSKDKPDEPSLRLSYILNSSGLLPDFPCLWLPAQGVQSLPFWAAGDPLHAAHLLWAHGVDVSLIHYPWCPLLGGPACFLPRCNQHC